MNTASTITAPKVAGPKKGKAKTMTAEDPKTKAATIAKLEKLTCDLDASLGEAHDKAEADRDEADRTTGFALGAALASLRDVGAHKVNGLSWSDYFNGLGLGTIKRPQALKLEAASRMKILFPGEQLLTPGQLVPLMGLDAVAARQVYDLAKAGAPGGNPSREKIATARRELIPPKERAPRGSQPKNVTLEQAALSVDSAGDDAEKVALRARVAELEARLASLEARLATPEPAPEARQGDPGPSDVDPIDPAPGKAQVEPQGAGGKVTEDRREGWLRDLVIGSPVIVHRPRSGRFGQWSRTARKAGLSLEGSPGTVEAISPKGFIDIEVNEKHLSFHFSGDEWNQFMDTGATLSPPQVEPQALEFKVDDPDRAAKLEALIH